MAAEIQCQKHEVAGHIVSVVKKRGRGGGAGNIGARLTFPF